MPKFGGGQGQKFQVETLPKRKPAYCDGTMQVALLQIENFRGIRSGKVQFRDHTVLIGPNNSGKTTIVEALALVLGRDRLVRSLTEHDFYSSNPGPASRIKIIATITGFEPDNFTVH